METEGGIKSPAKCTVSVTDKELNRLFEAMEAIKNELRRRGLDYEILKLEEEHPNAAYKRYLVKWGREKKEAPSSSSWCYVVSAVYGQESPELEQAQNACLWRFAVNPLVTPSWLLYQLLGPCLAFLAARDPRAAPYIKRLVAEPIVRASSKNISHALPWIIYLGAWGWTALVATALIVHFGSR